jgi:hypothetical protein
VRGEVQHRVGVAAEDGLRVVAQRAAGERGARVHRVRVASGKVIQHGDLVPGLNQLRCDDTADVPGPAGDQQLHYPP